MSANRTQPRLGERFDQALTLSSTLHRRQVRKGTDVPYVAHLLAVTALVLEDGGDEDLAIAALLHDAVEDQGGRPTLKLIGARFGGRVAGIVDVLTERPEWRDLPWLARKQRQLARLAVAPPEVLRIKAADTLHNVLGLLAEWDRVGPRIWDRFDPESCPVNKVWHCGEVAGIVSRLGDGSSLPARLRAAVQQLVERTHPTCDRPHEHPGPSQAITPASTR